MSSQALQFRIDDRIVGPGEAVYVIAEGGVNHDGSVDRAHELIKVAADAGADAVKFQTFNPKALTTATAEAAEYQKRSIGATDQQSMLAALTLPTEAWAQLAQDAADQGLAFMSTPFDFGSLELLLGIGMSTIKISSGDVTNHVLLRAIASTGHPVILSTGASTLAEVESALEALDGAPSVALLHCVTSYPSPLEESNLRSIPVMASTFNRVVGWSDHTIGEESVVMAIALGASLVEKHLTLDRTASGPDHLASADPEGLADYVATIRRAEAALGDGVKVPTSAELANRDLVRRSLHAGIDLPAGHRLSADDLIALRPGTGLPASTRYQGRYLRRALVAGEGLTESDLTDNA